jgi:hypothetical protein
MNEHMLGKTGQHTKISKISDQKILKTFVYITREIKGNSGRDATLFVTFVVSEYENRSSG